MENRWVRYIHTGDQWLITYVLLDPFLNAPKYFSVGHAFELYLKASLIKLMKDESKVIKKGHCIKKLLEECKVYDPTFLSWLHIKDEIYNCDLLSPDVEHLDIDLQKEFFRYQELYIVSKYLGDLKYLGTKLKKHSGAYSLSTIDPNPLWIDIFKSIREYLKIPNNYRDEIKDFTNDLHCSDKVKNYFKVFFI